jgi:hypothetical protein
VICQRAAAGMTTLSSQTRRAQVARIRTKSDLRSS